MLKLCKLQAVSYLFLITLMASISANAYIPDVYQDEYITVRAGVVETEHKPIHFGDVLTLVVEVHFNDREVLIETLGEDFFRKNWGAEKGINLRGSSAVEKVNRSADKSELKASFSFQILDCPRELTSCAGHKPYEIPLFTLGYQIVDGSGDVQNNKSVRFRPWPGKVMLTQALHIPHQAIEEFTTYFPGGAYPKALNITESQSGGLWIILTGGLLFLAGFTPRLFSDDVPYLVEPTRKPGKRWDRVLAGLQDESSQYSDEEWADNLRRLVMWFSLDELGINPCVYLHDDSVAINNERLDKAFREFFFDVINQESITPGRRNEFLNRFEEHARIKSAGVRGKSA
jgi:hypothetical protein